MCQAEYLMESDEETLRLDLKTDAEQVKQQAVWAGIKPGMRVADLGCGPGKTTYHLSQLIEPGGDIVGVDFSEDRIRYAVKHYHRSNIKYKFMDIRQPMEHLGMFDFVWVRFVLEYYRSMSFELVWHISKILKPGGILCLIDLDHNCLNHYGISHRLEKALFQFASVLEEKYDFDPYVGRKLFTYLYDLGFGEIDVVMKPHHLIFGKFGKNDSFNWIKKAEMFLKKSEYQIDDFPGGAEELYDEIQKTFSDPRRFTYTPLIACKGLKSYSLNSKAIWFK